MDKCPGLIGGLNDPGTSCNIPSAVPDDFTIDIHHDIDCATWQQPSYRLGLCSRKWLFGLWIRLRLRLRIRFRFRLRIRLRLGHGNNNS